ncbi:MAG: acyltransferase family protein, partial [Chitinophagales bacterium]
MYKNIKYFKGLNALRFIAAYLVVIHHAEQIRLKNELFNLKEYSFFRNGGIAVSFFFVLSGFLISYLLLKELKQTNTVKIKAFYIRRTLRIWPLYFLLV